MKWTNKYEIPNPIVNAIINDDYSKGDAEYSITDLCSPPRVHRLKKVHKDLIEEDVIDHIWILIGKSVHKILEHAADSGKAEERYFATINNVKISGAVDAHYEFGLLQDYKITNTYKIKFKDFSDWEKQLNSYAYLCHLNNVVISKLQVVAILRDWTKSLSKKDSKYPQKQIEVIDIALWPFDKTRDFLIERIKVHERSKELLPVCSVDDRWGRSANEWVRCEGYCSVSKFCDQYNQLKEKR